MFHNFKDSEVSHGDFLFWDFLFVCFMIPITFECEIVHSAGFSIFLNRCSTTAVRMESNKCVSDLYYWNVMSQGQVILIVVNNVLL
jgi:hypothetical protein